MLLKEPAWEKNINFSKDLLSQQVDVWVISLDRTFDTLLSVSEAKKLQKIGSPSVKKRFQVTRKALRFLLSHYLNVPPEQLLFEVGVHGKPYLIGFPNISFSVTHSESFIILAFSRDCLGLDLERVRSVNIEAIAIRYFSSEELAALRALSKERKEEFFFQLWTAKEAALKADGRGIAQGLRSAFSHRKDDFIDTVELGEHKWHISQWKISAQEENLFFIAALATLSPSVVIRWYDLSGAVNSLA